MRQSEPIYRSLKELREGPEWATLNEPQQRVILRKLLNAELAGIGLIGRTARAIQRDRPRTLQAGQRLLESCPRCDEGV